MASLPGWLLPLWFLFAAIWALGGTNAQAQLARKQLLADDDPLIADAGRAWTPFRLAASRRSRRQRAATEAVLRQDPERWARYDELRRQMRAWNLIESSVALAAGASILALIASFGGSGSTAPTEPASSSSAPHISAAAACGDFGSWIRQFGTNGKLADTSKMALLLIAISEAPSGKLHHDLNTLGKDVITASKATGSLGQAGEEITVNAAYTVTQDCQSVNPNS